MLTILKGTSEAPVCETADSITLLPLARVVLDHDPREEKRSKMEEGQPCLVPIPHRKVRRDSPGDVKSGGRVLSLVLKGRDVRRLDRHVLGIGKGGEREERMSTRDVKPVRTDLTMDGDSL